MAACASGVRIASAAMCSAIAPCSGCLACTVTSVSGGASFLQPGKRAMGSAMAPSKSQRVFNKAAPRFALLLIILLIIGSHRSRQRFEIGPRGLVAHPSVLARVLRGHKSVLRVANLQNRR